MSHDYDGPVDDSWVGEQKDQVLKNSVPGEDAQELSATEDCDMSGWTRGDQEPPEELEAFLAQPEGRKLLAEIHMLEEYHGLLPKPEHFNAYPPDAQRMLLEIASREVKAMYDDESRRLDDLTAAEIEQGSRGQVLSVIVIALALVAAVLIAIFAGSTTAVIAVMSIPFAAVVGNLLAPMRPRGKKSDDKRSVSDDMKSRGGDLSK